MAHKRNGKRALAERQERARDREISRKQYFDRLQKLDPEVRLLEAIFGVWDVCAECSNSVLRGTDCQSPHCKALRGEKSVFYDQVTTDAIYLKGGVMESGIDY